MAITGINNSSYTSYYASNYKNTENVVAQAVGTAPSIGGSCDVKA